MTSLRGVTCLFISIRPYFAFSNLYTCISGFYADETAYGYVFSSVYTPMLLQYVAFQVAKGG